MCQAAVQWCLMFGLILLAFGRERLDSSNSSACTRGCILKEFPLWCDIMLNVVEVKLIVLCQAGYNLVNAYILTRTDDICILNSLFSWRLNCLACELCNFFLFRSDIRSWCDISLRLAWELAVVLWRVMWGFSLSLLAEKCRRGSGKAQSRGPWCVWPGLPCLSCRPKGQPDKKHRWCEILKSPVSLFACFFTFSSHFQRDHTRLSGILI